MFDAHIVSQVIGDASFPLAVFLDQQQALDYRDEQQAKTRGSYVVHSRPLRTGGWSLR